MDELGVNLILLVWHGGVVVDHCGLWVFIVVNTALGRASPQHSRRRWTIYYLLRWFFYFWLWAFLLLLGGSRKAIQILLRFLGWLCLAFILGWLLLGHGHLLHSELCILEQLLLLAPHFIHDFFIVAGLFYQRVGVAGIDDIFSSHFFNFFLEYFQFHPELLHLCLVPTRLIL